MKLPKVLSKLQFTQIEIDYIWGTHFVDCKLSELIFFQHSKLSIIEIFPDILFETSLTGPNFLGSQEAAAELRKELQSLRTRVEALDLELQGKNEEVRRLNKQDGKSDDRLKV